MQPQTKPLDQLLVKDIMLIVQIIDNSAGYNSYTRRLGRQNCSLFGKVQRCMG